MTVQGTFLPFELQEEIVGHLWNDYKSLAACSLVSSQLSERARILLFSNVTPIIYGDLSYVEDDDCAKFMTFMELLEAPQSRLGRCIQRIYLRGPEQSEAVESYGAFPEQYSYFISILQAILPHLTRVSDLTLAGLAWNMIPDDVKIQLGNFTKVDTLCWIRIQIDHLDQILLFSAHNFPKLRSLCISELGVKGVSQVDWTAISFPCADKFPSLRALSFLAEESNVPLLLALYSNIIVPVQNIDTLDFEIFGWTALGYVNSILWATGPTLRVLKLQIYIFDQIIDNPDFELLPSLRRMSNLKSLHFMRCSNVYNLMWIRNVLRTTSCVLHNLEEIHLRFSLNDDNFLSIERAILEQKVPNIKVIIERIEWVEYEFLDVLKQSLPELSRRGQVHFVGWY